MALREYKISPEGTAHLAPGFLAGVRGPEGSGPGTVYSNRSAETFADISYESGACPFIEGPVTSVAGACVWVDL
jgi:hypothetical protein